MNIKHLLFTLALAAGANAAAEIDDPPHEYSPKEKLEWISSDCKWRMPDYSGQSGYLSGPMDQYLCHVIGRFTALRMANDANANKNTSFNEAEFIIIYNDHKGIKESCRLSPEKDPYDDISEKEFSKAYLGSDQQFDEFIKKLDANLQLSCSKM